MAATPTGEISRYPIALIADTTDWFRVTAYNYSASGSGEGVNGFGATGIGTASNANSIVASGLGQVVGHIILPMPSNIQDGNSVSYGEDKLNSLAAGVVTGSYDMMSNTTISDLVSGNAFNQAQQAFESGLNVSGLNANRARDLIIKQLAAEAVNVFGGNVSLESILARESGTILNPNMELLFNGVTLRTFRFSFKMTPRDNDESANIKTIIRFLKQKMAARGSGTFLNTPHIFDLSYRKGGSKHPFLHSFKPCFLKDMSVNYTGENVYATYSDGTPISMTMDLTFQEVVPVYETDYDTIPDTEGVGY